jgi:cation:H+ antiporter
MVFQSCIPVTIGIVLTGWHLDVSSKLGLLQAAAIGIALLSGVILYKESSHKEIKMSGLMIGGLLYILYIIMVLYFMGT